MAYCRHSQFKQEALDMSNICDQCGDNGTTFACKEEGCECALCAECHEEQVVRKALPTPPSSPSTAAKTPSLAEALPTPPSSPSTAAETPSLPEEQSPTSPEEEPQVEEKTEEPSATGAGEEPEVEEKTEDPEFAEALKEADWLKGKFESLEEQRATGTGGREHFQLLGKLQQTLKDKNYEQLLEKVERVSAKVGDRQKLQLWAAVRKVATAMSGPTSMEVTNTLKQLGLAHMDLKEYEAARANFEEALANYKKKGKSQDTLTTIYLGDVLQKLRETKKAKAQLKVAKEGLARANLWSHPKAPQVCASGYKMIASVHMAMEEYTEAEAMYKKAEQLYKDYNLQETEGAADCKVALARLYFLCDNTDSTRQCVQEASALYKKLGKTQPLPLMLMEAMAEAPKDEAETSA